jgi:hypothetical protein
VKPYLRPILTFEPKDGTASFWQARGSLPRRNLWLSRSALVLSVLRELQILHNFVDPSDVRSSET